MVDSLLLVIGSELGFVVFSDGVDSSAWCGGSYGNPERNYHTIWIVSLDGGFLVVKSFYGSDVGVFSVGDPELLSCLRGWFIERATSSSSDEAEDVTAWLPLRFTNRWFRD